MINLQGRLLALDPSANEALKVVSYFDSLSQAHAGVEAIVRAATALAGCAAGVTNGTAEGTLRVDSMGIPARGQLSADGAWLRKRLNDRPGAEVWLERVGASHVNDEMVLERLALSISIAQYRNEASVRPTAVGILIDPHASDDERHLAAARMHLAPGQMERVVASPVTESAGWQEGSAIVWTEAGIVRASLGTSNLPARAGVGIFESVGGLPLSWSSALSALQLTDATEPILWADDLGSILMLANQAPMGPDTERIEQLIVDYRWASDTMAELARHGSVRTAAEALGVHHSTLQARIVTIGSLLQFDVVPQPGRTRMILAFAIYRLRHAKF